MRKVKIKREKNRKIWSKKQIDRYDAINGFDSLKKYRETAGGGRLLNGSVISLNYGNVSIVFAQWIDRRSVCTAQPYWTQPNWSVYLASGYRNLLRFNWTELQTTFCHTGQFSLISSTFCTFSLLSACVCLQHMIFGSLLLLNRMRYRCTRSRSKSSIEMMDGIRAAATFAWNAALFPNERKLRSRGPIVRTGIRWSGLTDVILVIGLFVNEHIRAQNEMKIDSSWVEVIQGVCVSECLLCFGWQGVASRYEETYFSSNCRCCWVFCASQL